MTKPVNPRVIQEPVRVEGPDPYSTHGLCRGLVLDHANSCSYYHKYNRYQRLRPSLTLDLSLDLPTISIKPFTLSLSLDLPSNACTPTITPGANGYVPQGECNALYEYYPSFAAAIAFSALFGVLLIAHFVQATVHKVTFVWVIIIGAAWECTAFVTRAVSTRNQQDTAVLTVTQFFWRRFVRSPFALIPTCMLISRAFLPPVLNAFDYMVLARMINLFIPEHQISIFKPSVESSRHNGRTAHLVYALP
ncbi:hypothetical protein BDV10DRAFT_188310 [Aspergillus recurvatus]